MKAKSTKVWKMASQLDYNFNHFEMKEFILWLETYIKSSIELLALPFQVTDGMLFLLDIKDKPKTYVIFYCESDPPHKATLSIFHEIGHILFGHALKKFDSYEGLLRAIQVMQGDPVLKTRTPSYDSLEEREADTLALLLFNKVETSKQEITALSSDFGSYLRRVGL